MGDSNTSAGPREVLEQLQRKLQANDKEGFADLLAGDGVVEWPFTPSGVANHVEGREAMRTFVRRSEAASRLRYERVESTVHDTQDPEVIVVEMEIRGTDVETGTPFQLRSIAVIRARDGEIVSYRDYIDPLGAARVTGRLPQLFAALMGGEPA